MQPGESDQLRELERTAVLAELARPLVHECNNFLNTLLLQVALIEGETPVENRENLVRIRHDGRALASLIHEWQRYRRCPKTAERCDLNVQVDAALQDLGHEHGRNKMPVTLALAAEPLELPIGAVDLKRLCYLLLSHIHLVRGDAAAKAPPVEVRTAREQDAIVLSLQEPGVCPEWLRSFDERQPTSGRLVPAACKSTAQRLRARWLVESSADGAARLMLVWPNMP